ncbi:MULTISPECIES: histidinol-phosphate transaminase [Arthrobacter]|uniref:Aromatic amino acid aminotransferase n=2 Tax=Arthrobacter TaxID=1663 RepID=A0ABU9KI36_9MICC|nr:histidinol-phosphate transaminase [Arthrobacter sp. YJM1]MDP5226443.1 histidinol-phosphate transaminase [Arthrobacter sp. YJM1]
MNASQTSMLGETVRPSLRSAVVGLPGYVPGRRAQGADVAALASNENHHEPLPSVAAAVAEAAGRMNRYPDMGAVELRERIAAQLSVTAEEVAVGPGSVGVLQQIITGLCDAGDEVVFAWRSFEAYPILVELAGAVPVRVPLDAEEGHDLDSMAAAVTERTRVVLLCTPNNPTGVPIAHERIEAFLRGLRRDVLVVIDEAYVEYAEDGSGPDSLALYREFPNVCVLRTFSKAYGLAGLRVGYAVASPDIAEGLRRTAIPFGVTALAQQAAIASLDAEAGMRERSAGVKRERGRLQEALRALGWTVPESQGNFVWLRTGDELRTSLLEAFEAAGVMVRGYAGDGVRITVADSASTDRVIRVLNGITPPRH